MRESIEKYVKDRDKMLLKCSANELREFVRTHQEFFEPAFVDALVNASDKVLEITLHKMIVNVISLPFEFRQKSADWLMDRGYRMDIMGGVRE